MYLARRIARERDIEAARESATWRFRAECGSSSPDAQVGRVVSSWTMPPVKRSLATV